MNTRKVFYFVTLLLLALITSACKSSEPEAVNVDVAVALTQTAAAPAPALPATSIAVTATSETPAEETGFITGKAHLMAPPTPHLVIYAVDMATGQWFSVETPENDGETPFTLEVPAGAYRVFAFPGGLGYSSDGTALTPVVVNAGQTITDIVLAPPGSSDCGPMFGVPASPDGEYAKIEGVTEDCLASLSSSPPEESEPMPEESELMRIQFAPGDDSTQIFGDIPPHGVDHYILGAMAGQEMTVSIDVFDDNPITLAIAGADGTILNQYDTDTTIWTGILPATQDYSIDILSRDDLTIDYALVVVIVTPEKTDDAPDTDALGGITGITNYPEPTTPPIHIVATERSSGLWYWVGTAENASEYIMNLPPGSYLIAAYTQNGLMGGYVDQNGSFLPVTVGAAELVENIYLDWWTPDGSENDPVGW